MEGVLDLTVARDFAIALLIGALVGIERETKRGTSGDPGIGGLRTFTLLALIGALSGWVTRELGSPWVFAAALLAVAALVVAGYLIHARAEPKSLGLTTEVAGLVVCLLGGVTMLGYPEIAVALGIATSAMLAYKQPLHGLVKKLGEEDIFAGLKLLIATFIVLPLLPNEPIDPWGALNPYKVWWLVVLISGLSLVGYVAVRWLGTEHGTALTGMTGGLVSSTAVTLSFARRSRDPQEPADADALATGVLLAWAVMFGRMAVLVAIVDATLLQRLAVPLGAMGAATVLVAGAHLLVKAKRTKKPKASTEEVPLRNPFSLWSACKFALFFTAVLLVVELFKQYMTTESLLPLAALAGLTDVDAITLSLSDYARTSGEEQIACWGIVLAAVSNTCVKCGLILALADMQLKKRILVATGLILLGGAAGVFFV